jgi:hypothetical protein
MNKSFSSVYMSLLKESAEKYSEMAATADVTPIAEHHDEKEFPQELLTVSVESMLDLMEEQAETDEETAEFYAKLEKWLIDNVKELVPESDKPAESDEPAPVAEDEMTEADMC